MREIERLVPELSNRILQLHDEGTIVILDAHRKILELLRRTTLIRLNMFQFRKETVTGEPHVAKHETRYKNEEKNAPLGFSLAAICTFYDSMIVGFPTCSQEPPVREAFRHQRTGPSLFSTALRANYFELLRLAAGTMQRVQTDHQQCSIPIWVMNSSAVVRFSLKCAKPIPRIRVTPKLTEMITTVLLSYSGVKREFVLSEMANMQAKFAFQTPKILSIMPFNQARISSTSLSGWLSFLVVFEPRSLNVCESSGREAPLNVLHPGILELKLASAHHPKPMAEISFRKTFLKSWVSNPDAINLISNLLRGKTCEERLIAFSRLISYRKTSSDRLLRDLRHIHFTQKKVKGSHSASSGAASLNATASNDEVPTASGKLEKVVRLLLRRLRTRHQLVDEIVEVNFELNSVHHSGQYHWGTLLEHSLWSEMSRTSNNASEPAQQQQYCSTCCRVFRNQLTYDRHINQANHQRQLKDLEIFQVQQQELVQFDRFASLTGMRSEESFHSISSATRTLARCRICPPTVLEGMNLTSNFSSSSVIGFSPLLRAEALSDVNTLLAHNPMILTSSDPSTFLSLLVGGVVAGAGGHPRFLVLTNDSHSVIFAVMVVGLATLRVPEEFIMFQQQDPTKRFQAFITKLFSAARECVKTHLLHQQCAAFKNLVDECAMYTRLLKQSSTPIKLSLEETHWCTLEGCAKCFYLQTELQEEDKIVVSSLLLSLHDVTYGMTDEGSRLCTMNKFRQALFRRLKAAGSTAQTLAMFLRTNNYGSLDSVLLSLGSQFLPEVTERCFLAPPILPSKFPKAQLLELITP